MIDEEDDDDLYDRDPDDQDDRDDEAWDPDDLYLWNDGAVPPLRATGE